MALPTSGNLAQQLENLNKIRQSKPEEKWRLAAKEALDDLVIVTYDISGSVLFQDGVRYITDVSELPLPDEDNRIKLEADTVYQFSTNVDIGNNYIETALNNVFVGYSPDIAGLTGNYPGPMISGSEQFTISNMTLYNQDPSGQIIKFSGSYDPNERTNMVFNDVVWYMSRLGEINSYNNVLHINNAYIGIIDGFDYTGRFDDVIYDTNTLLSADSGSIIFDFDGSRLSNRVRSTFGSYISSTGSLVFKIPLAAEIEDERAQFIGNLFSSSGGAFVSGAVAGENVAFYRDNFGVRDTAPRAWYYMVGNATATTIPLTSQWVKIAGTTQIQQNERFDMTTTNRAQYTSNKIRQFNVSTNLAAFGGVGDKLEFSVAKNGFVVSASIQSITANGLGNNFSAHPEALVELGQDDYIEIWTRNTTDTSNVTVPQLSVIVTELA